MSRPTPTRRWRPEHTCSTSTQAFPWLTSQPFWRATIQLVQSLTDVPLSIDSSIVEALEAGLVAYRGKALVNSVTGEDEQMERVLPLVAKYGAAVVAISNDETGISEDPTFDTKSPRRSSIGRPTMASQRRRHRRPASHADWCDAHPPANRSSLCWVASTTNSA